MPNRMIRDWTDSLRMDGLSAEAERLFTRLIMKADDYGRFHGEPRLIKAGCFPLSDDVTTMHVSGWIGELVERELIIAYEADGRGVLAIKNYGQRLKMSRAKFPPLPGEDHDWLPRFTNFQPVSAGIRRLPGSSGKFPSEEKPKGSGSGSGRETETETETEPPNPQGGFGRSSEKKSDSNPTTPQAIRVASLFNRRPSTAWSAKEIRAYKALGRVDPEDLELVCRYTENERQKGDQGRHRRDLLTFLNNFPGELDRARVKPINGQPAPKQIQFID